MAIEGTQDLPDSLPLQTTICLDQLVGFGSKAALSLHEPASASCWTAAALPERAACQFFFSFVI